MERIDALWQEATDARYWRDPHVATSHALICQKLAAIAPWLDASATDALIRGASYVWK